MRPAGQCTQLHAAEERHRQFLYRLGKVIARLPPIRLRHRRLSCRQTLRTPYNCRFSSHIRRTSRHSARSFQRFGRRSASASRDGNPSTEQPAAPCNPGAAHSFLRSLLAQSKPNLQLLFCVQHNLVTSLATGSNSSTLREQSDATS